MFYICTYCIFILWGTTDHYTYRLISASSHSSNPFSACSSPFHALLISWNHEQNQFNKLFNKFNYISWWLHFVGSTRSALIKYIVKSLLTFPVILFLKIWSLTFVVFTSLLWLVFSIRCIHFTLHSSAFKGFPSHCSI